jgi:pimeloyl-ACP methyl ester carboxylesterase
MASGNSTAEWHEETVRVEDVDLIVAKGGSGKPLLILHEELGWPGWLKWNSALAQKHSLLIPQHPGFSRTVRSEWISNIRDMAGLYARYLVDQQIAPVDAIGFSLGGWIAAEMAACNPGQFRKLVLVAPMGIRPREGVILDFFQLMAPKHLYATVHDPDATRNLTTSTAARVRPSSNTGRKRGRRPRGSPGRPSCTIPACPICWALQRVCRRC